jgi:hypothetical protein
MHTTVLKSVTRISNGHLIRRRSLKKKKKKTLNCLYKMPVLDSVKKLYQVIRCFL